MEKEPRSDIVKSVQKSLVILKVLMNSAEESGLSDIQAVVGYNTSTLHHLLKTLMQEGFVSQNVTNKKYGLGPELFRIQSQWPQRFFRRSIPFLQECVDATGETTNVFIHDGDEAICVVGVESPQTLKAFLVVGRRVPVTSTAVGKIFLAFMEEENADELITKCGLKKYLPGTITKRSELLAQLKTVREDGYAVEREEYEELITAIAVPVYDMYGKVVAAVSNISPSMRTNESLVIEHLRSTAKKISDTLTKVYY
ncbi:MAG: IclR family transcriptional regulator [Negativicutes bacterium]|nr:IclR family transcriptional regulator [Negativicutes bacterium]